MRNIFVFGSNLAGRHGKGAALDALRTHGAVYGQAEGLQGNSYAIPTKDHKLKPLTLAQIRKHVTRFKLFASENPDLQFNITRIGCGLAGYSDKQIGPMFQGCTANCKLPEGWGTVEEPEPVSKPAVNAAAINAFINQVWDEESMYD